MRLFVRIACSLLPLLFAVTVSAQQLWVETTNKYQNYFSSRSTAAKPEKYRLLNVNASKLQQIQTAAPMIQEDRLVVGAPIELPLPDGTFHNSTLVETSIWQNKATGDQIGLKTYTLINSRNGAMEGNVSVWNNGISGIIFTNKGTVYINPLNVDNSGAHIVHYMQDVQAANLKCLGAEENPATSTSGTVSQYGRSAAGDCRARTYRLAIAATGEYTQWAGSVSQAKVYMGITMNVVNAIYQRDMNLVFSLVPNDDIIYTDPNTDPYNTSLDPALLTTSHNAIVNALGASVFDIGLVFNRGWSGGLAQLNAVCTSNGKGRGAVGYASGTGANPSPGPQGQWFDGATAHEIGHMFGAGHSFAGTNGSCGSNRTIASSWEPGSGSTVMAYGAAGCGNTNAIQTFQDYYFHAGSIGQMQSFISGTGGSCVTSTVTANVAPTASISTPTSLNIPANTPFVLTLNATDANGDALTYTWDQMDATSATTNQSIAPQSGNTDGPLFRSLPPNSSPSRYFPALQYLLQNPYVGYAYEVLPSVARTLNFRGTVRDNSTIIGCTNEVNVTLNVQSSTGFAVTNPAWGTQWNKSGNNTALVQWDVAGTNAYCSQVDIFLSTDGGYTYPITLATAVANNGSATVLIPSVNTSTGKVMVKGRNNVFFNINDQFLTIADPMPVTFLSFNARKDGDKSQLTWSTATESNSDKFIVERSVNGTEFSTQIGSVRAAGNSTTVQNYSFTDEKPMNNWNYYRLKQVDFDGKVTYSSVVSVYFGKDKNSIVSVYPNPVKSATTLDFYTERGGRVNIEIYDNKGSLVNKSTYTAIAGFNRTSVSLENLSTGVYTMKCYTESELIGVTKIIKN